MFADNSKYQSNLNNVFNYLASNATNPTGFYQASSTTTKETANVTVYGEFLCRGDLNATACQDCVTTATTTDLPKTYCPNRKKAVVWYEECMVGYSSKSYFGKLKEQPSFLMVNQNNITENITQFKQLVDNMLNNTIPIRAASGGSDRKFATSIATYTNLDKIYGMGQCTPDLSTKKCKKCLKDGFKELKLSQGARILKPSCIVRYELYPFFNVSLVASPPQGSPPSSQPPPPPESKISPPFASPPLLPPSPQPNPAEEPMPPSPKGELTPPSPSLSPTNDSPHTNASPSATRTIFPHYNLLRGIGIFLAINFYTNLF